jgi:hypothetical protein
MLLIYFLNLFGYLSILELNVYIIIKYFLNQERVGSLNPR